MREMTEIAIIFSLELTSKGKEYIKNSIDFVTSIEKLSNCLDGESAYRMDLVDTGYVKSYALMEVLEIAFSMLDDEKLKVVQQIADSNYGECFMEIVAISKDVFPEMYISKEYVKRISDLRLNVDIDLY